MYLLYFIKLYENYTILNQLEAHKKKNIIFLFQLDHKTRKLDFFIWKLKCRMDDDHSYMKKESLCGKLDRKTWKTHPTTTTVYLTGRDMRKLYVLQKCANNQRNRYTINYVTVACLDMFKVPILSSLHLTFFVSKHCIIYPQSIQR